MSYGILTKKQVTVTFAMTVTCLSGMGIHYGGVVKLKVADHALGPYGPLTLTRQ